VATSETIHVALAAAGLTALFVAVPAAFTVVRVVGAAYLIYLGVQAIRGRGKLDVTEDSGQAGRIGSTLRRRRAVRRGLDVTAGSIFIGLGVRLAAER
jgi:threonine/homoserine/homoserine lactone efflux protein